jgi:putative transposase
MSEKFRNKYRIGSKRMKGYDYSSPGKYFITICTGNRKKYFGDEKQLSPLGQIVVQEWLKTPEIRKDMNIILDAFIVMPDHFHAIIIIGGNDRRIAMHRDSTFAPQSKNLASIVRGFKSAVTTYARKNHIPFLWQPRFHDQIIWNDCQLIRIRKYIINNRLNVNMNSDA